MASWAPAAADEVALPRPRRRPRPRAEARPRRRAGVAGAVVWIAISAFLLAGVVALEVTVLRLNLRMDDLGRERVRLRAENAALASQVSSASDSVRIEKQARTKLHLEPADPSRISYLDLAR